MSCIFMPRDFDGPSLSRPAFSVAPEQHVTASWQITVDSIVYNYGLLTETGSLLRPTQPTHPSGVGKWVPVSAGKSKAGMVYSVSGWTRGVQVKLWDPLRTRAIPERLRGMFTTRRYTNPRLSYLTLPTKSKIDETKSRRGKAVCPGGPRLYPLLSDKTNERSLS